jgi:type IV secretory pathway TraG/TraD family ATPase VirD4
MTRALGPRVGMPAEAVLPFTILAVAWIPAAGVGAIWVGGHTASAISGDGWAGPPFGWSFAGLLLRGGPAAAWPEVASALVWVSSALPVLLLACPAGVFAWRWQRDQPIPGDPLNSLATLADVAHLAAPVSVPRAQHLRASLAAFPVKEIDDRDLGVQLGRLRTARGTGPMLRASWEDVVLAIMAPRAGKTTSIAIPAVLDAPGAVVATSNKADLWEATGSARQRRTGERVWVFDPQQVTDVPRTWWWNPLRGVTTVEEAHRLAGHFVQEVRSEQRGRDFWTSAAQDLLTGLLLAAGVSGRDLVEVYEWLNDPAVTTPVDVLRAAGQHAVAASLLGRIHGAPETRDGIYETARTAAQCLRDSTILAWVTPSVPAEEPVAELDAAALPITRQTLYLLSKEGAGAAAPLVAALTDRIMREATRAAERAGGRLDPPLVVVLDEAANVCRISDLPELSSHFGSRGIAPVTILQSYKQGVRVWGDHGMDALWSASTVKLIGAGLDDARVAEDVSRLVGDHDVPIRSINHGDRSHGHTISLRRQRVLPPEDVRALKPGTALLLTSGAKIASLELCPAHERSPQA